MHSILRCEVEQVSLSFKPGSGKRKSFCPLCRQSALRPRVPPSRGFSMTAICRVSQMR